MEPAIKFAVTRSSNVNVASAAQLPPPPTDSLIVEMSKTMAGATAVVSLRPGPMAPELPDKYRSENELAYLSAWYDNHVILHSN